MSELLIHWNRITMAECLDTGDVVVINPDISSGLPLPDVNRYPQPGSRPEKYATPATKGSHSLLPYVYQLLML